MTSGHQPSAAIYPVAPAPAQPSATLLLGEAGGEGCTSFSWIFFFFFWPPATAVIFLSSLGSCY